MVKILIDEKPGMADLQNDHGKTPLFVAAEINGEFLKEILNYVSQIWLKPLVCNFFLPVLKKELKVWWNIWLAEGSM